MRRFQSITWSPFLTAYSLLHYQENEPTSKHGLGTVGCARTSSRPGCRRRGTWQPFLSCHPLKAQTIVIRRLACDSVLVRLELLFRKPGRKSLATESSTHTVGPEILLSSTRDTFKGTSTMLRRTLAVARAPGLRAIQTVCSPLTGRERPSLRKHPHLSLFDQRLTIGGSLSNASTCPKLFQVRWRADNWGDSGPDFRTCQNVEELVSLAHCSLDSLSDGDIASFWFMLPFLSHKRGAQHPNIDEKLMSVIDTTRKRMDSFRYGEHTQTSSGIAEIVDQVSRGSRRYRGHDPHQILRDSFSEEAMEKALANTVGAFATAGVSHSALFEENGDRVLDSSASTRQSRRYCCPILHGRLLLLER